MAFKHEGRAVTGSQACQPNTNQMTLPAGGAEIPMSEKTYPYQAWVLMPSFKPKEVELVARARLDWEESSTGKWYHHTELHPSKAEAIAAGWEKIRIQQADIDKRQAKLNKRIVELDKAERE